MKISPYGVFVKSFRFVRKGRYLKTYGVATYVKARNGQMHHFKRLSGPMRFEEACNAAEAYAKASQCQH